jgi:hypothetical protein
VVSVKIPSCGGVTACRLTGASNSPTTLVKFTRHNGVVSVTSNKTGNDGSLMVMARDRVCARFVVSYV